MRGFQGFIDWEEKAQMFLDEIKKTSFDGLVMALEDRLTELN